MTEFETHVTDSLARLETNLKEILGNGQPGRLQRIEEDTENLKTEVNQIAGGRKALSWSAAVLSGAVAAIEFLFHVILKKS